MINYEKFSNGDRSFIDKFPKDHKFGIPVTINGEEFYPIWHERLFLRYYITYHGCLYDIVTKEITKHSYKQTIELHCTDDDSIILITMQELVWRTYFRFENGKFYVYDKYGKLGKTPIKRKEGQNGILYIINNTVFRPVYFPKDSIIHNDLIKADRSKIAISEDGSLYDYSINRFIPIILEPETGLPYIRSKNGNTYYLRDIMAYAWFVKDTTLDGLTIGTVARSDYFISKCNIYIYNEDRSGKIFHKTNLITQDLVIYNRDNIEFAKFVDVKQFKSSIAKLSKVEFTKRYGYLYDIPIPELYKKVCITGQGILVRGKTIVEPYKIVVDESQTPTDILYKFDEIYSLSDLYLWTFYRLEQNVIGFYETKFLIDTATSAIMLDTFNIISATAIDELSIPLNRNGIRVGETNMLTIGGKFQHFYDNICLSNHGAVFNSSTNEFIPYDLNYSGSTKTLITISNDQNYITIDLLYYMYLTWVGTYLKSKMKVINKSGMIPYVGISNIGITIADSIGADKIPKAFYKKLSSINQSIDELVTEYNL